jgi:phosphoribosyl-AMP cyclohydrolase / phosphoribosyl-ATP pyrophosphohydrolase
MITPDFNKSSDGLVPAMIQDCNTHNVLMLGYMNAEAFAQTQATKRVTFYSRSKQRLWVKGETSQNFLDVVSIEIDCDADTLLIRVKPHGPICHTGADTCFQTPNQAHSFLGTLENVIENRLTQPDQKSYINSLAQKGIAKIAQKVGEEAVEVVIEALGTNDHLFLEESADLLFHYLLLLQSKGFRLKDVEAVLEKRHQASSK